MATTEQPLKKQKLYNPLSEQPPPPPPENPPPPPPPPPQPSAAAVPVVSHDEALKKRRNKEEIRNLYECYKQIKLCVSTKDDSVSQDIEQAYLSLITASRGCSSVQRLVADLIPRYASYCPTALEAAAKVTINLHNWSLAVINRGEDFDNVAFETAKACIFGLVDICNAASSVTPTSSVIQGIYSEVFINVLMFLLPCLEGKDIFQIVDLDFLKIQESEEFFFEIKKKIPDKDESALIKLSKISAICLLRIFFCYPSSSLSACFELFDPTKQRAEKGLIFLRQVTSIFDTENVSHCVDGIEGTHDTKKCLMGLVFMKDPSLRSLISSKYKKLCRSASSETVLEVERELEPFIDMLKLEDRDVSNERDDSDPSRIIHRQNSTPRHNTHEAFPEISGRSKTQYGYGNKKFAENFPGPFLKRHSSLISRETDLSNESPSYDSGGFKSTNVDSWDHEDISHRRSSTPRDLNKNQILSPVSRKPSEFRSNSFDRRAHLNILEQNQAHHLDRTLSASHSSPANKNIDQVQWYSDGDPAAMDIFSACNQLWVGSLGPESSESLVKYRFEKFGPVEQFLHFPYKDFALVEYRYLMDAIRARRIMRGQSPWGSSLRIKFLDRGLGSKGYSNNVAIGSSCQVYIGNIQGRWAKDDILEDVRNIFHKGPRMVTDLNSENALLLEFDTPEEASHVMAHLRHRRKDIISPRPTFSRDKSKRNDFGENSGESPRARDLASLLSSLRDKYNIITHCSNMTREEDQSPTNTLLIRIFNSPQLPKDDEIKSACDISIGNLGSIIKLVRANIHTGSGWFVECSSVDIAKALLKNLQDCPKNFFQIQFSQSGMQHSTTPISHQENHAYAQQGGPTNQSNYPSFTSTGTPEVGTERTDGSNHPLVKNPVNGGNHVISGPTEQPWMYRQADQSVVPPPPPSQPFQTTPFAQPMYYPQYGSWDGRNYPHHNPYVVPNTPHHNSVAPTFVPTSAAPLSQIGGNSFQNPSHIYPPPPGPAQPQPPHQPQPPFAPPPPPSSPPPRPPSPPPQPPTQYKWQGALSKSGAHYCTIFAQRVEVESCKYSYAAPEPSEWPAKLDMTKRTDFRHVKSTFNSTPPHKREVCWLFPSSDGDHKGFQDFITYLKQRECAGVFKIPVTNSMWARLLFILPCSEEIFSLLSITPNQSECLVALVLPKETTLELV